MKKLSRRLGRLNTQFSMSVRSALLAGLDAVLVNLAALGALLLRFEFTLPPAYAETGLRLALPATVLMLCAYWLFSLYNSLWRYASVDEMANIVAANLLGTLAVLAASRIFGLPMYRSFYILFFILATGFTGLVRFTYRFFRFVRASDTTRDRRKKRILVVGAGQAGAMVAKELQSGILQGIHLVGFVDDDPAKRRQKIHGAMVLGAVSDLPEIAASQHVDEIVVAIPTLDAAGRKRVLAVCKETSCKLRILPGVYELIDGKVSVSRIRDVAVEDLLGRAPVKVDMESLCAYIKGKTVFVTGGAGSIGSELCRQIAKYAPGRLVIIDLNENAAYTLQREMEEKHPDLPLSVHIASIRDRVRLEQLFERYKPHKIFHAAAHKHVPLMENDPAEAVKNNIFGTLNLAELSHAHGVRKFVMISTDKAVNPTNVMGATKRAAEKIVQAMDKESDTEFVAVRFGNVLGSNGSVIPLFKGQIARGGPVTVTHPEILRYFMTIPEAVSLVLQAGAMASGGEVFVLDMGEPVKILDLARDLIRLSGLEPGKDIKIEFTGLRPGEKLFEELLMDEEGIQKTENEKIFIGKANQVTLEDLRLDLEILRRVAETGNGDLVETILMKLVETYRKAI